MKAYKLTEADIAVVQGLIDRMGVSHLLVMVYEECESHARESSGLAARQWVAAAMQVDKAAYSDAVLNVSGM